MGVRIESIGIFENGNGDVSCSLELVRMAAQECIKKSHYEKNDIGVIINSSIYRDKYFAEPAFASFVQNDLQINHEYKSFFDKKTFCFDIINGALGFLSACQVASAMIVSGKAKTALIVSGDVVDLVINDQGSPPGFRLTGAAMLLDQVPDEERGFDKIFIKRFEDHMEAYRCCMIYSENQMSMLFRKDPAIEEIYLKLVPQAISEFFSQENLRLENFDLILPPQLSPGFVSEMAALIGGDGKRFIDVSREDGDLFNASLPMAMGYVFDNGLASPGQKALIVNIGSGLQVACAVYNF
jgi:3-oxoacyl-[acyl-carrier-protein] synthase III